MLFGPENVIVVAGINKLVPSLREAAIRLKNVKKLEVIAKK